MMETTKKGSLTKNTAVLYVRMLVQMVIYLYTSRVIASVLGMEDWGIFDVVGGIVLVISFLNNSMTVCSQRYLTYAIGYGEKGYLERVYSVSIMIHTAIAILLIVLGETIGLWYLKNYVVIPADRLDAALMVFHCSLLSAAFMVSTVPFNALVIAYEKMTAFAAISITDVILKLLIVLSLSNATFDRLKVYALLLLCEMILIRMAYIMYCNKKFHLSFCKLKIKSPTLAEEDTELRSDKVLFYNMLKFSGWSIYGNLAVVCNTQGINLLLNVCGGPILNAARVIAFNVQTAITAFVSSFQTAMNPRITKHYASGDIKKMNELVFASSRISYMLIYIVALPLLMETPFVLHLWLGEKLPQYAVVFTRLLIMVSIIDAIANPLTIAVSATGKIKKYHLIIGGILLMVLPAAAVTMFFIRKAELVFCIQILFLCLAQVARMLMCRKLFQFDIKSYMEKVGVRIIFVTMAGTLIPVLAHQVIGSASAIGSLSIIFISVISAMISAFLLGLGKEERLYIINIIKKRF